MNPMGNLSGLTGSMGSQPFSTSTPEEDINENLGELIIPSSNLTDISLPGVVGTQIGGAAGVSSTILQPVTTDLPISQTTLSSEVTTNKITTASTNTETTLTTLKTMTLPRNSTMRRPTVRSMIRNANSKGRLKARNFTRISTTMRPSRISGGNMTAQSMPLTMNSLADLDHPENLNLEVQTGKSINVPVVT